MNGTMTAKCNNCTAKDTKEEPDSATGHTGGEASCTRLAICTECGESYGEYAEHIPVSYPETLPGCETAGSTGGTYCSECLVTITEPVSVPPDGTYLCQRNGLRRIYLHKLRRTKDYTPRIHIGNIPRHLHGRGLHPPRMHSLRRHIQNGYHGKRRPHLRQLRHMRVRKDIGRVL